METTAARIKPFRPTGLLTRRPIAGRWRNAARIGFGGFFLAMAAFNTTMVLPNAAESYRAARGWALALLARDYDRGLPGLVRRQRRS